MLFLYIYCLTFVCVVNCNSTEEKLKELNILVNNDVWSEFEKGPRPIEHTNGQSRKISFRELFSKSNGAVFTEDNYLEKSKNFHTMLSCNFAVGFKYITIIMNEIWKESNECISETEKTENGSSEEYSDEKDWHEKLKDELNKIFSESKIKEVGSSEEDYNENLENKICENTICENNETFLESEENGSSEESSDEDDWRDNFIFKLHEKFYKPWISKSEDIGSSSTPSRVENEAFLASENTDNYSNEEYDLIKLIKNNLTENLDASVPELMQKALLYFTQLSEIEEKESILPALNIMIQFANDKFSIDCINDNILKMNNILTQFIKNKCWFNENSTGPMLKTVDDIHKDSWLSTCAYQHCLAVQIKKLNKYFKKRIIDLGFKNVK